MVDLHNDPLAFDTQDVTGVLFRDDSNSTSTSPVVVLSILSLLLNPITEIARPALELGNAVTLWQIVFASAAKDACIPVGSVLSCKDVFVIAIK